MRHKPLIFAVCILLGACAPKLGDSCGRATDCSANGDRVCDESQPGGYCTIANCEPGSCGGEGLCVRFLQNEPRRTSQWCMAKCSGDCDRGDYACKRASDLISETGKQLAEVLDSDREGRFCVVDPDRVNADAGVAKN